MESKALVKSTNSNVTYRFFARTPSWILRMVNICEVVDPYIYIYIYVNRERERERERERKRNERKKEGERQRNSEVSAFWSLKCRGSCFRLALF